ncbi:discoidin domain-containing protein [Anaeromassilibacillus senegalensis]|uniref:discoidin domain-containing protein n=1 Tax=Anaeromassilibacillus senegalensis TaxID=1673717 RepID=UPI0009397019|nr:discoidin domain-containing protein [Anaeromassilibacillus senegalensis]
MQRKGRKVISWILALSMAAGAVPAAAARTMDVPAPVSGVVALAQQEAEEIVIPQSQMTATAESAASGEGADKAIDGNNGTKWHSNWSAGHPICPLSITLDLGEAYDDVYQLRYLPRQDSSSGKPQYNGVILGYEISVSDDGTTFTKVAEGEWAENRNLKTASFTSTGAKFVRLTALTSMGNSAGEYSQFASAAEINIVRRADFAVDAAALQSAAAKGREFLDGYEGGESLVAVLKTAVETGESLIDDLAGGALLTQETLDAAAQAITAALADIAPAAEPTPIPQSQMTATADSYQGGNEASKALDGNNSTHWHSNWTNYTPLPHYITLDLGKEYTDVYQMKYLPRQDKDWNGTILQYEISASMDGESFTKVAAGEWEATKDEKTASFAPVAARYLRLTALTSENNEAREFASAAEVNVSRWSHFTLDTSMLLPAIEAGKSFIEDYAGKESLLDDLKNLIARAEALLESTTPTQEEFVSLKTLIEEEIEKIQSIGNLKKFVPGDKWLDTEGDFIQAHGGGIMYDTKSETYYWYGENKDIDNDPGTTRTPVVGVSCYSSKDLYNWKYEGLALDPKIQTGEYADELGPENVLERPKVIYNDSTGKYVMWAHIDSANYGKAAAGVAVSDSPTGPFTYIRSERPNGQMSRDMTLYKDEDGKAYLIYSSENNATLYISLLSDDYLSQSGTYTRNFVNMSREAPAMFKHDGKYYIVSSGCTGWSPNAAGYGVADSPLGPFEKLLPNPCVGPDANLTFRGQSTHVLPVEGRPDKFIFMADRWNANNLQDSRYLWLPMQFNEDGSLKIEWMDEWDLSYFGADRSELLAVQKEASALKQADYTPESWAALQTALLAAADLAEDADQAAVDAAAKAIRDAIDALENVVPSEKTITIRYSGRSASLSVNEVAQPIADKIGMYSIPAEAEELTLTFTPPENRLFAGVQLNGAALAEKDFEADSFTVVIPADEAALGMERTYSFTVVSKFALETAVRIAESCVGGDEYNNAVQIVQDNLDEKLKNAQDVLDQKTATQAEIDEALNDLLRAVQMLSFEAGDTSALSKLIETAEIMKESGDYTETNWDAFLAALDEAKEVVADSNALKVDVERVSKALVKAMEDLVRKADKSGLETVLNQALETMEIIDQYVPADEAILAAAIEAAQDVYDDPDASQTAINEAADTLAKVLLELRLIPDKSVLEDWIDKSETINPNTYTTASYRNFMEQIDLLKAVYEDPNASQADVDEVCEKANKAWNALKTAGTGGSGGSSRPSKPSSTPSTSGAGTAVVGSPVVAAAQNVAASVRSDTTLPFTLKKGAAYCFKMTVVNGNGLVPNFTVGDGSVLKTQFVAQIGNDYYYRVWAVGAPGQSTGVYTTLPGQNAVKHCIVTIG